MASWVIPIKSGLAHHWDVAVRDGFWDLRKTVNEAPIEAGDLIYFWQSGGNFIGRARALTPVQEITPGMSQGGWDDAATGGYRTRVMIDPKPGPPSTLMRWADLNSNFIAPQGALNFGSVRLGEPKDMAFLESLFTPEWSPDPAEEAEPFAPDTGDETDREYVYRAIASRRGQPKFREQIIDAYGGRCVITGCDAVAALEAAHITAHSAGGADEIRNGLLLRADIHTLFDLNLIALAEDADGYRVELSPVLAGTSYEEHAGVRVAQPEDRRHRPDPQALAAHRRRLADSGVK